MAFDSRTVGSDPGETFRLSREFGRTFIALSDEPPVFRLLDASRAATLTAFADGLIPGNEIWPSASESGAPQYADNSASLSPIHRSALREAIDLLDEQAEKTHGRGLGDVDRAALVSSMEAFEADQGALFTFLLELIYEGYYRDPNVQQTVERQTGFKPEVPVRGMSMDPFDESRLDRIKARPQRVRESGA